MTAFSKEMMEKQMAANKEAGAKNAAAGEKFLAENKKKEGVKTTASGLQYKVLKEGTGASPKETDTVVTQLPGTLIDGTEFDSSYKRNEPATFPVNRVIKGWTEALQLMKPGPKYQLFIPAILAYGERGAGQDIGPNETLIFEVELLASSQPKRSPAPQPSPARCAASPPTPAPGKPAAKPSPTPAKPVTPRRTRSSGLRRDDQWRLRGRLPGEAGSVAPQILETVELAFLAMENVHDHLHVIEHDPLAGGKSVHRDRANPVIFFRRVSISPAIALRCGSDVPEQMTKKSVKVEISCRSRTTISSAFLFEANSAQVFARFSAVILWAPGKAGADG